jgi:ASPIC/UnbV protein/VCBS repeat protein
MRRSLLLLVILASPLLLFGSGFTRVPNSTLAQARNALGAAWGDFNNDGWVDLVVSGDYYLTYTNRGDGTFVQITNRILGGDTNFARTGTAWADYDNDGFLDLAIGGWGGAPLGLYHNRGDGQFTRITTNIFNGPGVQQISCAWGDYDNDGFVDLFVPTAIAGSAPYYDLLFRNNGNGSFAKITNSPLVQDPTANQGALWADIDNDGDLDLFVTSVSGGRNRLYRNDGAGVFVALTNSPVVLDGGNSGGCAWGDFDNDGDLDLFVTNFSGNAWYYVNDGRGGFTRIVNSVIVQDGSSAGCIAFDYDNDGWLDIATPGPANRLYHNNGDGTFSKILSGDVVTQPVVTWGNNSFAAADVDRDGFQDLLWVDFNANSQLFKNDGNTNAWLSVRCEGRMSNRAGIGAKVRVNAWLGGQWLTQLREIGGGGLVFTQNEPVAAFGLGDATNAALVRIEWPSGLVQHFTDVAPRQFLHVVEPVARISPLATNVPAGSSVTFSLTTAVDADVQWFLNGAPIFGETNASLVIPSTRSEDLGTYTVQLRERASGMTFEPAPGKLTGGVAALSVAQTNYIRLGSNLTLNATATGVQPLAWQWFHEGAAMPGATQPSLLLTNLQIANEGAYTVGVSNGYGGVLAGQGSVVVLVRPTITVQPLGQETVTNGTVGFSVSATGHPMPLIFRWRRNAVVFTNITVYGSNSFITLHNVQPVAATNRITFTVAVTNLAGSVLSSNAVAILQADADGDGLPDDWELAHGLNPSDPQDALLDADADGISNLDEFTSGTDPNNAGESLRFDRLTLDGENWRATFHAQSNRTYAVQSASQLGAPWTNLWHVVAAPSNEVHEITAPRPGSRQFFRLKTPATD